MVGVRMDRLRRRWGGTARRVQRPRRSHFWMSSIRKGRMWRVQITQPDGSVRYFGRFSSERRARPCLSDRLVTRKLQRVDSICSDMPLRCGSWWCPAFAAICRASSHVRSLPQCPLYPQKRTLPGATGMSALCQKRKLERIFHPTNQPAGATPADQAATCSK